jgi:hypothetical protein
VLSRGGLPKRAPLEADDFIGDFLGGMIKGSVNFESVYIVLQVHGDQTSNVGNTMVESLFHFSR